MDLRGIKTFLNWLKDHDKINSVPKIKQINSGKPLPIYLSNDEFESILKRVDRHYQRAFHFYRETGCRLSEPFEGELSGDFLTITSETAKTHSERDIYLTPDLKQILIEMREAVNYKVFNGIASKWNAIVNYSKAFHKACKPNKDKEWKGIEGRKFHSLRHTFAVRRYLQTRDLYQVAKEMGHSSIKTTEIYSQFRIRRLQQDFPDLVNDSKIPQKQAEMHKRDTDYGETDYIAYA